MAVTRITGLVVVLAFAFGCSPGGSAAVDSPDAATPGEDAAIDVSTTSDDDAAAPHWSEIYADYFASGTPGHCGDAGCHITARAGFACGATAATCYAGMVTAGLLDPASPKSSALISASESPVRWFSAGGNMPQDDAKANPAAAAAVLSWVNAGALDN